MFANIQNGKAVKKAPNHVFVIDDDQAFFNLLSQVIKKEVPGIELVQVLNYDHFLAYCNDETALQSTLLAVVDKMIGNIDILIDASNLLNKHKIPHIVLSSNQVSPADFKKLKKNKHCLNIFLKENMQSIAFQLIKTIDNTKQHLLQINAIENARITSIAQGLIMGKSGLTQQQSEAKLKTIAESENISVKEAAALIMRLHDLVTH